MASEHRARRPLVLHARTMSGFGGGPEKTILNSPRYLEELGYDALCAYSHPPGDEGFYALDRRARSQGLALVSIDDRGATDWRVVKKFIQLCRRHRVDVWHAHDYKTNVLGLLVRRFWPMKLVTTVHGWVEYTPRTPMYYRIDKLCLRYYDQVVCVSEDLYQICRRHGVAASRCHVVSNAIDAALFRRRLSRAEARGLFAAPVKGLLLGGMGRLSAEKGFDLLIRAVAELVDQGQDVSLWIAGDGCEQVSLEQEIRQSGLQDRVTILGHVDDPASFLQALDVFVLSSVREGLPNVVLEAMALKVPVVATRVAGVPRLVKDGTNGLVIAPGSTAEFTEALQKLIENHALREELAQEGRSTIEHSFSFEQRMRQIANIYDRLWQPTDNP